MNLDRHPTGDDWWCLTLSFFSSSLRRLVHSQQQERETRKRDRREEGWWRWWRMFLFFLFSSSSSFSVSFHLILSLSLDSCQDRPLFFSLFSSCCFIISISVVHVKMISHAHKQLMRSFFEAQSKKRERWRDRFQGILQLRLPWGKQWVFTDEMKRYLWYKKTLGMRMGSTSSPILNNKGETRMWSQEDERCK